MHALSGRADRYTRADRASRDAAGRGAYVLPRLLRKPVRYLQRLFHGDVVVPRYAGLASTAVFFGLTGLYGAYLGGHIPDTIKATTSAAGFGIDNVKISGNERTSEIDVLGALNLDGSTSLVGIGAQAAQAAIDSLPWVASSDVLKIYPDTLRIVVRERKPFAIWQHGGELSIIDRDGRTIVPFSGGAAGDGLPMVVGDGAATTAASFIADLGSHPAIADHVKAYIRVGDRRWNLELDNGVTIMLPEEGFDRAIDQVVAFDRRDGLLSRDISVVDMRFLDRVVVRLTPEAAARRDADLKALKTRSRTGRQV